MHRTLYRTGHRNQWRGSNKWSVQVEAWTLQVHSGFQRQDLRQIGRDSQRKEMIRQVGWCGFSVVVNPLMLKKKEKKKGGGVRGGRVKGPSRPYSGLCELVQSHGWDNKQTEWCRPAALQKWGLLDYCDEVQLVAPPWLWLWHTHRHTHARTYTVAFAFQKHLNTKNLKYSRSIQFMLCAIDHMMT